MDDLYERAARAMQEIEPDYFGDLVGQPTFVARTAARAIVDLVLEETVKEVKAGWVSADYDVVGILDADMAMKLCEHIAAAIRSLSSKGGE